ncbi:MAG: M23 family metallopeptidase [Desulfobulbaceae bacterium]|nr:M23 family metallopeptidase [Desulfobulbaceae bacterium]HIJ79151.1 M23 family metallopeptidase [Deltaproteobacteria bacterium]
MDNKLHFMVTSERGVTRSFIFSKDKLQLVAVSFVLMVLGSFVGWYFSCENVSLRHQVAVLKEDLRSTIALNQNIQERVAKQEKEQKSQLDTALTELRERSDVIKSILNNVGVDLNFAESADSSGGPFAKLPEGSYESLTLLVDQYLDTIHSVPLGVPVPGVITSRFGRRIDPFNQKPAFHGGVDVKNKIGTEIKAPAAGVVVARGHTRGFGNFLEIDHGNSFQTRYLHMKQSLVKNGEKVARGQVIGLVGTSGRSTGSHLHYEIKYRDKLIDPVKFMRVGSSVPLAMGSN